MDDDKENLYFHISENSLEKWNEWAHQEGLLTDLTTFD